MATTPSKARFEVPAQSPAQSSGAGVSAWPRGPKALDADSDAPSNELSQLRPSRQDALQALLAFSALHEQIRRRRALGSRKTAFDAIDPGTEFEQGEQFVLDEVLQLVAERAVAITGANGMAIALAENGEIVLRASAGTIKPDVGARIDRDSAFSGACFRTAEVVRCDDTETDQRVNLAACRRLGARSMVAVPLCGRRRVIGLLEAFSTEPFGFNDSDVRSLSLLAELILGALKPEDEDRFAESAEAASTQLDSDAEARQIPSNKLPVTEPTPQVACAPDLETIVRETTPPDSVAAAPLQQNELWSQPAAEFVYTKIENAGKEIPESREAPTPEEVPPSHHRPGVLVVLAFVVIAALVGAAIWWKIKSAQVGSALLHSGVQYQKSAASPPAASDSSGAAHSAPAAPPAAGPNLKSNVDSNATADGLSEPAPQTSTSANAQELSKLPRVTGIRHWSSADSSTVVLDLQDQVQYEAHRLTSPERIYFDLHDTVLAPELAGKNIEVGDALLNRVRVAQPLPGMTRVVLETKGNSNFSVSLEPNPYRLVVEVRRIGANPRGSINLFPNEVEATNRLAIVVPPPSKEDLLLRARVPKMRIVVDAGHGGWDLGTVGRRGLLEKDVVLEIAERLGKLLESRLGTEVLYTRQDDNYIPLDERAEIANQAQADLFVSVHANYSDLPSARGVETYYTNFFSAPSSKDVETRTNPSSSPSAVTAPLSPADLHERIEQSRRLAASVQRSLYGTLSVQNPGLRDRGIKEAGFVVLTETAMPGILAEVSFVSSPTDEQKLRSDGYREQIAEALYKGIARYAANSHGVKVASAAK